MVILIFVIMAILTVIGVLLRRRHLRNRDKITSSFNAGITTRNAPPPMASVPGSRAPTGYGDESMMNEEGRATPSNIPYGYTTPSGPAAAAGAAGRSESRLASYGNLARVRERDRATTPGRQTRGTTPVNEVERGNVLRKGKGKVDNVGENEADEIGAA